ncbi:hypothetical protein PN36_29265 [Candidatus Thiomargarita nelsonii]|uniref:Uncharacterized protein n=1 Tax=Candidatus Thiomargarita nelsonii TaxID=1003181 RepID=A0A4E0QLI0_9GAMM|nr:hypothetical protein PN36_29265 [Candidatus Thiomargarita nelsonii]
MNQQTTTLEPISRIKFLRSKIFQQSETGWGDYTIERHQWLGNKEVKTLAEEIIAKRMSEL